MVSDFESRHKAGARLVTASSWPTLVLPPEQRPGWMPSPYAYAAHLLGRAPLPEPGPEVERGKDLEPVALAKLEREHGYEVTAKQIWKPHAALAAGATLDALVRNSTAIDLVAETKVVDERPDFDRLWQPRPPLHTRLQAQAQLACSGYELALIVALVMVPKGTRLEIFEEPRRDDVIAILEHEAREFLAMLDRGEMPEPDETASSYYAWQRLAEFEKDSIAQMRQPEATARARAWLQAKADHKAAEATIEAQRMWFAIHAPEHAEAIELGDGTRITRKRIDKKGHTVPPHSYVDWRFKTS